MLALVDLNIDFAVILRVFRLGSKTFFLLLLSFPISLPALSISLSLLLTLLCFKSIGIILPWKLKKIFNLLHNNTTKDDQ